MDFTKLLLFLKTTSEKSIIVKNIQFISDFEYKSANGDLRMNHRFGMIYLGLIMR